MRFFTLLLFCCLLTSLTIACEKKKEGEERQAASTPIDRACENLYKVADEPIQRCKAEMPTFLEQCPELVDGVLDCMAQAPDEAALFQCTEPCMMVAADEMLPAVPASLDIPELEVACVAMGVRDNDSSEAGHEYCRRWLANEASRCPEIAEEFFECYTIATDKEAVNCLLTCHETQIKRSAKENHAETPDGQENAKSGERDSADAHTEPPEAEIADKPKRKRKRKAPKKSPDELNEHLLNQL